jgi:hypothetical protein
MDTTAPTYVDKGKPPLPLTHSFIGKKLGGISQARGSPIMIFQQKCPFFQQKCSNVANFSSKFVIFSAFSKNCFVCGAGFFLFKEFQ